MGLDLVDGGDDGGLREELGEGLDGEVAHASREGRFSFRDQIGQV